MNETIEVLFVSDTFGSISVWDLKNGANMMNYTSNFINHRCLDILKNEYVLAVEKGPLISVWPINSQKKIQSIRLLCPGIINCFSLSYDGLYIAVSIKEKLLIWQISTGKLLCTVVGHYQSISVVKWAPDNSDIVTGGEDGVICVWKLSHLISSNSSYVDFSSNEISESQDKPRFTFSDHSVKITDLFIGNGKLRARLYTVSADKTCKIYDLSTGTLLLSIIFNIKLSSITVDQLESIVFVGTADGSIKVFSLLNPPRSRDHYFDGSGSVEFVGHTKTVNCLAISADSTLLISGSMDETIKIWYIDNKQCVRTIKLKGSITNVVVKLFPNQMLSCEFQPTAILKSFEKRYGNKNSELIDIWCPVDLFSTDVTVSDDSSHLHEKIELLQTINRELYDFSVRNLTKKLKQKTKVKKIKKIK